MCNKAFIKLTGLGKYRFSTLSCAARRGEQQCPYDGRYMIKEKKAPSPAWEAVHSFLTGLWMDVAEPIPDGLNSNRRPRSGSSKRDAPDLDRSQLKHLPHASITEYWKQCADAFPHLHIGRKLFSSDPQLNLPYVIVLYSFGIILLCYVRICEEQSNIN